MSDTVETDWVRLAPSDVFRAVVAVVSLVAVAVVGRLFDAAIVAAGGQVFGWFGRLPTWFFDAVSVAGTVLMLVLLVAGLVVAVAGRHWRLLAMAVGTAAVAAVLSGILNPAIDAVTRVVPTSDLRIIHERAPSAALLTAATAVVVVTATSLPRLWRRLAWVLVMTLMLLRFVGEPLSLDAVVSVVAGWAVGSIVVVLLGAPSRHPRPSSVMEGLRAVGLDLVSLEPASVDARGSTPYFGTVATGERAFVKVLGEDERSADLLFRLWRFIQPRNFGDQLPFTSLRRGVEHEALVAVMARQFGVRTPRVAGVATAHPNGFVLAYEAVDGRSLDALTPEEMTDAVLAQAWEQVAELRRHRIAHRDLRLANVFLDSDGTVFMIDFGFSELAAEDLLLETDIAELLASSATVVGPVRALAVARSVVGPDVLATAGHRMVPSRLSGATRTTMKGLPGCLEELRAGALAASADGVVAPAPASSPNAAQ